MDQLCWLLGHFGDEETSNLRKHLVNSSTRAEQSGEFEMFTGGSSEQVPAQQGTWISRGLILSRLLSARLGRSSTQHSVLSHSTESGGKASQKTLVAGEKNGSSDGGGRNPPLCSCPSQVMACGSTGTSHKLATSYSDYGPKKIFLTPLNFTLRKIDGSS